MTDHRNNPTDQPRDDDAPPALKRDLAELFRGGAASPAVPAEIDSEIRSSARAHLAARERRLRLAAWSLAAAALLAVLFSLSSLVFSRERAPILTAMHIARQLGRGDVPLRRFDANRDGVVNHADIASIINVATALPENFRRPADAPSPRRFRNAKFLALEVWVDPKGQPLAAYQVRFGSGADAPNRTIVVGVESGQGGVFGVTPPYYDRTAVDNGEAEGVVLAMMTTAPVSALPSAKSRVATIHLMVLGGANPSFDIRLDTAATADGKWIPAEVSLIEGEPRD